MGNKKGLMSEFSETLVLARTAIQIHITRILFVSYIHILSSLQRIQYRTLSSHNLYNTPNRLRICRGHVSLLASFALIPEND